MKLFILLLFVTLTTAFAGESMGLSSKTVFKDLDGAPYVEEVLPATECSYPHYCNSKGTLYALKAKTNELNQKILQAMTGNVKVSLKGAKGKWNGQDDGWQIYELWVEEITLSYK